MEDSEILDALEAAEAGMALAEAIQAGRSLRHPDHAKLIKPITRRVKKLMAGYFTRQGDAIQAAVKPWLKLHMGEALREAADEQAKQKALDFLPDSVSPL